MVTKQVGCLKLGNECSVLKTIAVKLWSTTGMQLEFTKMLKNQRKN